jgi:hypothetical protein
MARKKGIPIPGITINTAVATTPFSMIAHIADSISPIFLYRYPYASITANISAAMIACIPMLSGNPEIDAETRCPRVPTIAPNKGPIMEAARKAGIESNAMELPNGLTNAPNTERAINIAHSVICFTLSLFFIKSSKIKLSPYEHDKQAHKDFSIILYV